MALRLSQTQLQIKACETAMVFAFVEVTQGSLQTHLAPLTRVLITHHIVILTDDVCVCVCVCVCVGDSGPGGEERRMDPAG